MVVPVVQKNSVPVLAIVGPTGSGKSDLAVGLAEELGAEVINADAMQFYRGMDIGTAKLGLVERRGVRHHLLDILDISMEASVAKYQRSSRMIIGDLSERSKPVILVGGSGLYIRAALDVLDFPGTDPEVRGRLEVLLRDKSGMFLYRMLEERDPVAAAKISVNDSRRIIRALEVVEITGKPFSSFLPVPRYVFPTVQIGLGVERSILRQRLADRVEVMWGRGFVDEVGGLLEGNVFGKTAERALGYAQILSYLRGECSEFYAKERTIVETQQFAKRQMTWFSRDKRVEWFDADDGGLLQKVVSFIGVG